MSLDRPTRREFVTLAGALAFGVLTPGNALAGAPDRSHRRYHRGPVHEKRLT